MEIPQDQNYKIKLEENRKVAAQTQHFYDFMTHCY